ncbi:RNA polymerase sigma factor [Caldimonas brevitalea]|uniref:RNA polymerase sigma factor n=2 Tax=Caldimonas brevitalea TaxID=413882 RepID=A0A0G3BFY8_9BURK|nr:RNA polymerase sigma factor [Caldimonas brevitalea]
MRRHNRRLYRLARATLHDAAEAEDALQEAYLSAYRSIAAFRGQSSVSTWLSRLVLNECLGRLRKQSRRDQIVHIVSSDGEPEVEPHLVSRTSTELPNEALARAELRALLERKLDELPQAFRTVFMLRGVEEMSVEETAQALDIPEATVRSRYFRARSLLREALAQEIDLAEQDVFSFAGARCDRIVTAVLGRVKV